MYTLYYSPGSCSRAVHCLLEETAAPYQAQKVENKQAPDFLAMNPRGQVPTLVIDGQPYFEAAALVMILAERHPEAKLALERLTKKGPNQVRELARGRRVARRKWTPSRRLHHRDRRWTRRCSIGRPWLRARTTGDAREHQEHPQVIATEPEGRHRERMAPGTVPK